MLSLHDVLTLRSTNKTIGFVILKSFLKWSFSY